MVSIAVDDIERDEKKDAKNEEEPGRASLRREH